MTPVVRGTALVVHVVGRAAPQGSKDVRNGHSVESNPRARAWRQQVQEEAADAAVEQRWRTPVGAVEVEMMFEFLRPRSVGSTAAPTSRATGDVDKLARAVLDALTLAGVLRDDSQVVRLTATKSYGETCVADCLSVLVTGDLLRQM
jgi:Holliday junction resolvase RusA-like endonuclease